MVRGQGRRLDDGLGQGGGAADGGSAPLVDGAADEQAAAVTPRLAPDFARGVVALDVVAPADEEDGEVRRWRRTQ